MPWSRFVPRPLSKDALKLRYTHRKPRSSHQRYSSQNAGTQAAKTQTRFDRIIAHCPRFTRPHLLALRHQPISVLASFLLIHEITAIVPLFGLAGLFHYYRWLPPGFAEGEWVLKVVGSMGRMLKRWGWVDELEEAEARREVEMGKAEQVEEKSPRSASKEIDGESEAAAQKGGIMRRIGKWWTRGEDGTRVVIEFATAYAVVKVLLIPRLMVSAWLAPWFARRLLLPIGRFTRGLVTRKKPKSPST